MIFAAFAHLGCQSTPSSSTIGTNRGFGFGFLLVGAGPALAQNQMLDLVNAALSGHPSVLGLVYYDDVILACPHSLCLEEATNHLVGFLRDKNLQISAHKCCLTPKREIDWIGKHVGHCTISNTDARVRQLAGVLMGLSRCRSVRLLRRVFGWVSWYGSHFPAPTVPWLLPTRNSITISQALYRGSSCHGR